MGRENSVNSEVSVEELAQFSKSKKDVVMARAKELRDAKRLNNGTTKGTYVIADYYINSFLDNLDAGSVKLKGDRH